ncbi:hypothetical protein LOTGIDRAFT_104682 [Lottia gigantea]|uniref:CWH43-like N-terminal domain-containing protein n=1 Tax=Lottia gigantea TaxID=225164 RepID=V4AF48_LOTGI|nr:hypothetical protein LOTGIDRAFT_104682 [Lottia gigantea]ESO93780.1 hypothetical protein LOTGIDRAFT_104682 [Lottia gigantea]
MEWPINNSSYKSKRTVQPVLFHLPIPHLVIISSLLPIFATIFCIIWSILYNFQEANHTHCNVYNFFPSVSSTISHFAPQKYIWRICIALHCGPRFFIAISYYKFHTSRNVGTHKTIYKCLVVLNTVLHIMELIGLITLSYVSSTENYRIHESMFILFIISSILYMLLTCFLIGYGKTIELTKQEKKSLNLKVYLVLFKISMFLISLYFFYRHNNYCEPRVYSVFSVLEYVIIFTNILFHATLYCDIPSFCFTICDSYLVDNGKKHH